MGPGVTTEMIAFFEVQMPATLLLGLVSGVFAVQVLVVRRGRMSLRANSALVLISALEASAIAPNPAAWRFLLGLFFLVASSMALVDLGVVTWLDHRRESPRLSLRARRFGPIGVPIGLTVVGTLTAALLKNELAPNPDAVSLPKTVGWFFALLAPFALMDLAARATLWRVNRYRGIG